MTNATDPRGGARVWLPAPLLFVGSIGAGVALRYLIAPPPMPGPRVAQIVVGVVLTVAATALGMPAYRLFKKSGQSPKPWTPSPSLLAKGPYRFSRNPMYVGMVLQQVGLGIALGNWWIVLLAALSLVIVHFTSVLPEEAYLVEQFGEPYRQYQKSVRRYL